MPMALEFFLFKERDVRCKDEMPMALEISFSVRMSDVRCKDEMPMALEIFSRRKEM